jgi:predicted CXXCH cytochrome family protein
MRTERKVLRRLVLVTAASAALFMGAWPAQADNGPHVSTATTTATTGIKISDAGQGRCASCHRAHTAKSAFLLSAASEESLCFSCHGGSGTGATTDVQNGVGFGAASSTTYPDGTVQTVVRGTQAGALRGGGFDQAMLGTDKATKEIYFNASRNSWSSRAQLIPPADAPEETTSSHFGGVGIMWGNGAIGSGVGKDMSTTTTAKLECSSCHDPHGNDQYRILKPVPSDSGFSNTALPNGIVIKDTANKVYTTTNYWIAGDPAASDTKTTQILGATSWTNPTPIVKTGPTAGVSSFQANVAAWCTTCHTRYLAPSQSYKTSSGDDVFTYRHTGEQVGGESSNRNCIQCHVAHGSNAVMPNSSVEWPSADDPATSTAPKSSDSRLLRVDDRGVCVMCHNV